VTELGEDIQEYCDSLRESSRTPLLEAFLVRFELFGLAVHAIESGDYEYEVQLALGDHEKQELSVLVSNARKMSSRLETLLKQVDKSVDLGLE
jgi:hypothetical protein